MSALAALALAWALAAEAHADGTFRLVQCDPLHAGIDEALRSDTRAYDVEVRCASEGSDRGIRISVVGDAAFDRGGRVRWVAPPHTSIVGVRVEAKLRRHGGHRARLFVANGEMEETARVATGSTGTSGWHEHRWTGSGQRQFVAELSCGRRGGCDRSDLAKTWIRNVRITVADHEPPTLNVSGALLEPGWKRGEGEVGIRATDIGSGLSRIEVRVGGAPVYSHEGVCGSALSGIDAWAWVACDLRLGAQGLIDTRSPDFSDGSNTVRLCARDFSENEACIARTVKVDNAAPMVRFFADLYAPEPELIRADARDPHSGVFAGAIGVRPAGDVEWTWLPTQLTGDALEARVDSSAMAPGEYEFIAQASDEAGNTAVTTQRSDDTPMVLAFPLREGVRLTARLEPGGATRKTVRYGKGARLVGALKSVDGEPLANREIVVDENFGAGALIDHRVRVVTTDERGRWRSRLPAGPTRRVTARFDGDLHHVPTRASGGRLAVRTGARLRVSSRRVPEGRAVTFKGKIGRVGARIPAPGKLVQLQYQDPVTRRWYTVRNPFYTDSRGRFKTRYRFGTHYATNVKIRFRLRALPERDWPYRAARSAARRVTVLAR